jgi:hypothetical protein
MEMIAMRRGPFTGFGGRISVEPREAAGHCGG